MDEELAKTLDKLLPWILIMGLISLPHSCANKKNVTPESAQSTKVNLQDTQHAANSAVVQSSEVINDMQPAVSVQEMDRQRIMEKLTSAEQLLNGDDISYRELRGEEQ